MRIWARFDWLQIYLLTPLTTISHSLPRQHSWAFLMQVFTKTKLLSFTKLDIIRRSVPILNAWLLQGCGLCSVKQTSEHCLSDFSVSGAVLGCPFLLLWPGTFWLHVPMRISLHLAILLNHCYRTLARWLWLSLARWLWLSYWFKDNGTFFHNCIWDLVSPASSRLYILLIHCWVKTHLFTLVFITWYMLSVCLPAESYVSFPFSLSLNPTPFFLRLSFFPSLLVLLTDVSGFC